MTSFPRSVNTSLSLKERLGHGSIATTEMYLRTLPEADETALDALSTRGRVAVRVAVTVESRFLSRQRAANG
jgi:hypothetical protein